MKLHLPHKLRAALLACFTFVASTVGSASADYVWIGEDNFTAGNWNVQDNWEMTGNSAYPSGGSGPATPDSNAFDKLVFDGKGGTTPLLEGWTFQLDVTGNVEITTSVKKFQGGCSVNVEKGSKLNLTLEGSANDGNAVAVGLGGTFNMILNRDKGGDATTVNYGDLATTAGVLNLSSSVEGTARNFNSLIFTASLTATAVSDTTELHEYTFCTFTSDVNIQAFSSQITSSGFVNAGDNTVLAASDENIGKYSVVKDDTSGTIKLYYVTGQIATLTWNGGTEGTWAVDSTSWLSSAGAEAVYTNRLNVVFSTEGANITVSGDIDAYDVSVKNNTTFTIAEGATLSMVSLDIAEGATLTAGTMTSLVVASATGTGDLVLTMNSNGNSDGNSTISLPGSQFGSVTIAGGVLATNINLEGKSSDLGSADLIMANGTTYVIRNGVGGDASVTSGTIKLQGNMNLQVYGGVADTTLSNNIVKADEATDTSILKTDGGTVELTGSVAADHLYVSAGTLKLGSGAAVTVSQVRLSENGQNGNKLVIEKGAVLNVTGTNNAHATTNSLMLAHYAQTGFLEINGGELNASGALAQMNWDGKGTLSVTSGTAKLKGIQYWGNSDGSFGGAVNLGTADGTEEAVLELGESGIQHVNSSSVLNLGNGTLKATANTHIGRSAAYTQGTVNLIGTAAGTRFDTNGFDMTVGTDNNGSAVANAAIAVTGGGNLVKAGAGTLTFNGSLEAGALTIEQGTLQLNGAASVTQTIINDGTLTFGENGSLSIASLSKMEGDVTYTDPVGGVGANGYAGGTFTVIRSSSGNSATTVTGLTTVTLAGKEMELKESNNQFIVEMNGSSGSYFINEGTLVYGAADNCMTADTTTGIVLNGGTLQMNQNLNAGVGISLSADGTVSLASKEVTLSKDSVTANGHTLTLSGSGKYVVANISVAHVEVANLGDYMGATLGDGWTGTVMFDGGDFWGANLGSITKGSIELSGVSGMFAKGNSTCTANLILTDKADGTAAFSLTNGWGGDHVTFSGAVSGSGTLKRSAIAGSGKTFTFTGDVSKWTGKFDSAVDAAIGCNTLIEFSGNATTINASVTSTGDSLVNVTISNDKAVTVNGEIELAATTADRNGTLTLGGTGAKSFTNTVTSGNITISGGNADFAGSVTTGTLTANGTASFGGTTTIGTLNANRTLTNSGTLTISTALQETIANASTALKVATDSSTLTHTTGADSTDGNGYMSAGYGYVIESTGTGSLTLADSLTTPENYKLEGNNLLYKIESADAESIYYINTNTNYSGSDVAQVGSGKTILVTDGANLTMTEALPSDKSGLIFKTSGSGSVTLDRKGIVLVGEANGLLSTAGTDIGRLVLASGTKLEYGTSGHSAMLLRTKTIVVEDGATFSHRVYNTINASIKFEICGNGDGTEGSGALVLCDAKYAGTFGLAGTVTLTGDATICTSSCSGAFIGALSGEVVGNGYTLTKTGARELRLEGGSIGTDKMLDAALHVKQGAVRLNFSNVNMTAAGAESRKIAGKVTLESGTTLDIFDGYTELAGGLQVNGDATLNAQWAKGANISGLVEGGAEAVLHIRRDGMVAGDAQETLVLGADNSGFTGTWQVEGDWKLRADHSNALGNAKLDLQNASAVLAYGEGVSTISLAGLSGVEGATVNGGGAGTLTLTGAGTYDYAGTLSGIQAIVKRGDGSQTLADVADGADLTVSGGSLTVTKVVSARNVSLDNGATLAADVTLGGILSGTGIIDGDLTSTAGSAIALDLTGAQVGSAALITATSADVTAGKFSLNLSGLTDLENGLYSLLQWQGIAVDQFNCEGLSGSMELVVNNNILSLRVGTADLYWKGGTTGTWDASEKDWATDAAATTPDTAYAANAGTYFISDPDDSYAITIEGAQATSGMVVKGGTWTFDATGAGDSLSVGNSGISIDGASVTLKGSVTSSGTVKMKNDSTLVAGEGTLSLSGLDLAGTTVTHTGSTEDVLSITSDKFSVSGGTLTNTTTGDVTVGIAIQGNDVGLVQNGGGTLTLGGNHNLASLTTTSGNVALTGSTTVGGTSLTNSTVTTGGEAFSLGSDKTTVNGGSVSTSDTAVSAALTNVALTTTNADQATVISGTQNLTSLTNGGDTTIAAGADVTVSGKVQLKANKSLIVVGSLANDNLVISGGSVITAETDKQLSLWNQGSETGQTIAGGAITDNNDSRDVFATLNGVDYTFNGGGTLTLNGTQTIGTLTAKEGSKVLVKGTSKVTNLAQCTNMQVNAGASLTAAGTVSGTLTNSGSVTASGNLTVGALVNNETIDMDSHDLTLTSATTQGGTISNAGSVTLAGDSNVFTAIEATTVSGSGSLSVSGNSSIGTLNGVTGVTVSGESTTLTLGTADSALTLSGEGKLDYGNGALSLDGDSTIGSLKAGSLALTGTSTLDVNSLELTDSLITLSDLTGMAVGSKLVTADEIVLGTGQTDLKIGLTADTIDAIAGNFDGASLTLAQLTGLTGVTFADGTETVESSKLDRVYRISVDDAGNVTLTYEVTGNGWKSADGTWNADDDFASGDPNGKVDGQAAFLGGGTSEVNVVGDKTINLLKVEAIANSSVNTYTFTGDKITADIGLVADGTMIVKNEIEFTESLTVKNTPTIGNLTIETDGKVTVGGKAMGIINNKGTLSVGEGSDISLGGDGALTTAGNVTVAMRDGASIDTLTVNTGSALALTTDATAGTLANQGTVTVAGDLTLTGATTQGGNVQANNLTLATATDNTFGTLAVTGTVNNTGTLTVGDGTSIGTLAGDGALTVSNGAVEITSDTTISTLTNSGTLTVGGDLTLTEATTQGGNVQATNLTLANGTDNTFGKLSVTGTVNNTGTLTVGGGTSIGSLAGNGSLTTSGDVTVTTATDASVNTLTVGNGTATFTTDTTVEKLAGTGSLVVQGENSTLTLNGTDAACTVDVTAGTLNLTGSTAALNLGQLTLDTIVFDSDNAGTEDAPLVTATGIVSPITLVQDMASGLLAAGDYKLLGLTDGGTANLDTIQLDAATISAYQTSGFAVELRVEGSTVQMVVVEDNARTWNTSGNTLEDTLGHTVQNSDGTPLELVLDGENVYKSLDGVTYVHVDGDSAIDLTNASPDSATDPNRGLVVNNLSGDGEHTLSIEGDGDDRVTLATQQGFTPEQTANLSLSGLEATLEGDLSLKDLTMKESSLDANGNTLTVENLAGDAESKLSGSVIVTGSNSFLGTYGGNTRVELTEGSEQTLNASAGLTVTGSAGTAKLDVKENASITAIDTTGTNVTLSNGGVNTLVLTETSTMEGGTFALEVSLKKVSDGLQGSGIYTATTKSALKLTGVTIEVTMTDTDKVSELSTSSKDSDIILFRISDHEESTIADCTLTIHDGALLDKYFSNIRLVQGSINVVGTRRTNYYGDKFTGLSANGAVGVDFAGLTLSYVDPQNSAKDGDLAKVLNALDKMAPGANEAADDLGAAFAGAGTAAMGVALAGDMDRQLRAIRNRTTTMGVSGDYVYDDMPAFNAWINAEGDYRTLDKDGTMAGYTLNSWGGTVGVDVDFSTHFTIGLAATAMYGDLKADSAETKAEGDMDTYYVSLFARYADKAWVHTFVTSVGMSDLTMDRTVTCGGEGSYTTSGDTSGISFGMMYEAGYVIALDEEGTACLQPVANITYKHTSVDGYNESGSDAALKVGDQTLDSVTLGVGARFQAAVGETVYNRTSLLEMRALAKVEIGDRSSSAEVSLPGVPNAIGTVESAEADAFGIELGAGITIPVGVDSGALFIDASAELRGTYTNVNGTFGYRINF